MFKDSCGYLATVKLPPWWAVRVNRRFLVLPPSPNKVVTAENAKTAYRQQYLRIALPPKRYRHIFVLPPPPKSFPPKTWDPLHVPPKQLSLYD